MVQKDFNNSLDDYISTKRKNDARYSLPEKTQPVARPKTVYDDTSEDNQQRKQPFYQRFLMNNKNKEADADEFEAEEQEILEEEKASKTFGQKIKGAFGGLFKGKDEEPSEDSEPDIESGKKIIDEIENIDKQEEKLQTETQKLSTKRRGLIKSFFAMFESAPKTSKGEVSLEDYQKLEADLKEVSKFTIFVLHQIPKRKLDEMKESDQLVQFKEILKKRNLIK